MKSQKISSFGIALVLFLLYLNLVIIYHNSNILEEVNKNNEILEKYTISNEEAVEEFREFILQANHTRYYSNFNKAKGDCYYRRYGGKIEGYDVCYLGHSFYKKGFVFFFLF